MRDVAQSSRYNKPVITYPETTKEHVDADVAARQARKSGVIQHDQQHSDSAEPLDVGSEIRARDSTGGSDYAGPRAIFRSSAASAQT